MFLILRGASLPRDLGRRDRRLWRLGAGEEADDELEDWVNGRRVVR